MIEFGGWPAGWQGAALLGLAVGAVQRTVIGWFTVPRGTPPGPAGPRCCLPVACRWVAPARCAVCRVANRPGFGSVEPITVGLFTFLWWRWAPAPEAVALCWLAGCSVVLCGVDLVVHRLPDAVTAPAWLGTLALLFVAAVDESRWAALTRALLGGLVLAAGYLLLVLANPAGMGLGDAKLAGAVGAALGWIGWPAVLAGTVLAFTLAAVTGLVALLVGRITAAQPLPFAPFMLTAAFVLILRR